MSDVYRVVGVELPLRTAPYLYAVLRMLVNEDDGRVELGDAMHVLQVLAKTLATKRARIRAVSDCTVQDKAMLCRLEADAANLRKHFDEDGELDGDESTDMQPCEDWLAASHGRGALQSRTGGLPWNHVAALHRFMMSTLVSEDLEEDGEEDSYVMAPGPLRSAVELFRESFESDEGEDSDEDDEDDGGEGEAL
jgi:hypothetical protein